MDDDRALREYRTFVRVPPSPPRASGGSRRSARPRARSAPRWRGWPRLVRRTGARASRSRRRSSAIPCARAPSPGVRATTDADAVFATRPTVIVEALGGLEPARTLVLDALARGIPVVTANKSLLAHHGKRAGRRRRARRRLAAVRGERRGRRAVSWRLRPPPVRRRADVHHRHRQRHDQLHPVADGGRGERLRRGAGRGATPRLRRAGPVEGRGRDRCRREARSS